MAVTRGRYRLMLDLGDRIYVVPAHDFAQSTIQHHTYASFRLQPSVMRQVTFSTLIVEVTSGMVRYGPYLNKHIVSVTVC